MSFFAALKPKPENKAKNPVAAPITQTDFWAAAAGATLCTSSVLAYLPVTPLTLLLLKVWSAALCGALVCLRYNQRIKNVPLSLKGKEALYRPLVGLLATAGLTTAQNPAVRGVLIGIQLATNFSSLSPIKDIIVQTIKPARPKRKFKPKDYHPDRRI